MAGLSQERKWRSAVVRSKNGRKGHRSQSFAATVCLLPALLQPGAFRAGKRAFRVGALHRDGCGRGWAQAAIVIAWQRRARQARHASRR
jgi:hypothetical protein